MSPTGDSVQFFFPFSFPPVVLRAGSDKIQAAMRKRGTRKRRVRDSQLENPEYSRRETDDVPFLFSTRFALASDLRSFLSVPPFPPKKHEDFIGFTRTEIWREIGREKAKETERGGAYQITLLQPANTVFALLPTDGYCLGYAYIVYSVCSLRDTSICIYKIR